MANYGQLVKSFTVPRKGAGMPDYSAPAPTGSQPSIQGTEVFTSTDIAELGARQNRAFEYDRRGNVVYFDDFSNPFDYWTHMTPATSIWDSYRGSGNNSGACMMWEAARGVQWVRMKTIYPSILGPSYPYAGGRIGVEARITMDVVAGWEYLGLYIWRRDYNNVTRIAALGVDWTNYRLEIINPAAAPVQMIPLTGQLNGLPLGAIGGFLTLKVVADFDSGRYMRTMFTDLVYKTDRNIYVSAPGGLVPVQPSTVIAIWGTQNAIATVDTRLLYVKVTVNEPED